MHNIPVSLIAENCLRNSRKNRRMNTTMRNKKGASAMMESRVPRGRYTILMSSDDLQHYSSYSGF